MSKIYDFLKDGGFYYLLTIDGEYPSGRLITLEEHFLKKPLCSIYRSRFTLHR